jgi:large subunit ribosomal protein L18
MADNRHKIANRTKRAWGTRMHIRNMGALRLSVHRSGKHIYGQVLSPDGAKVLAAASSLEQSIRKSQKTVSKKNIKVAEQVGTLIAERAVKAGIHKVAFDRGGLKYHGGVKAFAEAARSGGLSF